MTEIYFDHAATSFPKPESVYDAINQFMRTCGGNPSRGSHPKSQEAERKLIQLRSKLSRLLNIPDPSRLILTMNATDALNLALKGFLQEGDHVIATDLEHNAVLRPLWGLRKSKNINVTIIKATSLGEINPKDIENAITDRTKLICCVHASNVLGTILPIREISKIAHAHNVAFLVDGSQTAGAIPVDVEELGVDFFAFTGHKSLLGPTGTGGLYVRSGIELTPFREGGNGSHSESLDQPAIWPERHESGTPNMFGLVGLLAGVEFLLEKGVQNICEHERHLNQTLMNGLKEIPGIIIYGPEANKKVGITSISFNSLDSTEAGQMLGKKFKILVRTGLHCAPLVHKNLETQNKGTIRFSIGHSNTIQEIEQAVSAVREIAGTIYRKKI